MSRRLKVGRNHPCPCRSGRKYKHCCEGRIDWAALLPSATVAEVLARLSVRGKNLWFLEKLAGSLQLDRLDTDSMKTFKRAFTPQAVREIFEASALAWIDMADLSRCLVNEAEKTSALYVGLYDPARILLGVTRHSLYSERILLVDPFMDFRVIRDEYNPVLHPEQHAQTALRWSWVWLSMAPWIEADLVHVVRAPESFDTELMFKAGAVTEKRYAAHPELKELVQASADEMGIGETYGREMLLRSPDWYLRQVVSQAQPDASDSKVQELVEAFRREREQHPFVLEPPQEGGFQDLTQLSTGTSYEMAKWTASISGSHLVTDLKARWAEIECDYDDSGLANRHWSPFAKALGESNFKALNAVPSEAALEIRQQGALQPMRDFLGRVWRTARSDQLFAPENAEALSAELRHEVAMAEEEWKKIDRELIKWSGAQLAAGIVAGVPWIASGSGAFVAGGLAVAGVGNLIWSQLERRGFKKRHPAAFFLDL